MPLPPNVSLTQISLTMVEVSGWASEPFVMTQASALKSLERIRSRRAQYETPQEYERHLSVYVEAMRMMEWEIPDDPNAPIDPIEPVVEPLVAVEPPPVMTPATSPGTLPGTQTEPNTTPADDTTPTKPNPSDPVVKPKLSWVDRMSASET